MSKFNVTLKIGGDWANGVTYIQQATIIVDGRTLKEVEEKAISIYCEDIIKQYGDTNKLDIIYNHNDKTTEATCSTCDKCVCEWSITAEARRMKKDESYTYARNYTGVRHYYNGLYNGYTTENICYIAFDPEYNKAQTTEATAETTEATAETTEATAQPAEVTKQPTEETGQPTEETEQPTETKTTERTQSKAEETTADTEANSYDVIIRYPCYRIIDTKAVKNYDPNNRYTHVHKNVVYMDPREYNIKATNEETAKRIAVNKCLEEVCTDLKCTHVSQYDKSDYFYAIYDENTHFEIVIRNPKIEYKKLESRKIYIVTAGIYSGYHIEAVFDNEDEALKYAALNNTKNYDEMDIEEYNLSHIKTTSNIEAYFYYKAHIDVYTDKRVKSMTKAKCKDLNGNKFEQYTPIYEETKKFDIRCKYEGPRLRESIKSRHWTDLLLKEQNDEKAKKIFQDRFAQQKYMYEMGEITLKEFLGYN